MAEEPENELPPIPTHIHYDIDFIVDKAVRLFDPIPADQALRIAARILCGTLLRFPANARRDMADNVFLEMTDELFPDAREFGHPDLRPTKKDARFT